MKELYAKIEAALNDNPVIEHEQFVQTLDYRERRSLLPVVRDMEKQGILRRDISEKRQGRFVLKYIRVQEGSVTDANSTENPLPS